MNADTCADLHPDVMALYPRDGESDAQFRARVGALYRTAPKVTARGMRGRPPLDRSHLIACLETDTWTPAAIVAAQVGLSVAATRIALLRARRCGAPIESRSPFGWRLKSQKGL